MIITRDARPVAKLVRFKAPGKRPRRFDPVGHGKWQRKVNGNRVSRWVEPTLAASDRIVHSEPVGRDLPR